MELSSYVESMHSIMQCSVGLLWLDSTVLFCFPCEWVRGEWVLSALQSAEQALEALLVALEQLCQTVGATAAAYSLPHTDM